MNARYEKREKLMEFLKVHLNPGLFREVQQYEKDTSNSEFITQLVYLMEAAYKESVEMCKNATEKGYAKKYYRGCSISTYDMPTFDVLLDEQILADHFNSRQEDDEWGIEYEFQEIIDIFLENCGMPITFRLVDPKQLPDK